MKIKVQNGTPVNPKSICHKCSNSMIIRGPAESQHITYCREMGGYGNHAPTPVPFDIVECNQYSEIGKPSLYDMRKIAWIITADKSGKKMGFVPAAQFKKENEIEEFSDIVAEPNWST